MIDRESRFLDAIRRVVGLDASDSGIGTLREKSMHRILKIYLEPRDEFHEIKYLGKICDIKNENGIFEIQTRSLDRLSQKLSVFLKESIVTVVLPLSEEKRIKWLNKETGELSEGRKSPRREGICDALRELYKIRGYLTDPNLRIKLVILKTEEYRYLNGWDRSGKRGSTRIERIPTELLSEIDINCANDYKKMIPDSLSSEFTVDEFVECTGCKRKISSYVIGTLVAAKVIEHIGKRGRAFLYRIKE